jgi:hypothetical protein
VRLLFFAAGAALVALTSALSIAGSRPSLLAPFSMIVVVPYLVTGSGAGVLACPVLYVLTGLGLLRRRARIGVPVLTFVALATTSAVWLAWGYEPGLRHYGAAQTHGLIAINALAAGVLAALMLHARQRPGFARGLALHVLAWCWASWSAFAWLRQVM